MVVPVMTANQQLCLCLSIKPTQLLFDRSPPDQQLLFLHLSLLALFSNSLRLVAGLVVSVNSHWNLLGQWSPGMVMVTRMLLFLLPQCLRLRLPLVRNSRTVMIWQTQLPLAVVAAVVCIQPLRRLAVDRGIMMLRLVW